MFVNIKNILDVNHGAKPEQSDKSAFGIHKQKQLAPAHVQVLVILVIEETSMMFALQRTMPCAFRHSSTQHILPQHTYLISTKFSRTGIHIPVRR